MSTMVGFTLYPVIYALLGSLKTNFELISGGSLLPHKWMFSNYAYAFTKANFVTYTFNSMAAALLTMALALVTSSMAGYVLARFEFPGKKQLVARYLSFMFVSLGSITLLPLCILLKSLGLTKSIIGMALVMTGGQAANVFQHWKSKFENIDSRSGATAVFGECGGGMASDAVRSLRRIAAGTYCLCIYKQAVYFRSHGRCRKGLSATPLKKARTLLTFLHIYCNMM